MSESSRRSRSAVGFLFAVCWGALAVVSALLGGLTPLTVGWAVLAVLSLSAALWLRRSADRRT